MARDRGDSEEEGAPDLQDALDALNDPDCRTIIAHVETPMTASEISDACDIPLSTTYRKLDLLTSASMLIERTQVRDDGHHATQYWPAFESVRIALNDDREFDVSITRPSRTADERLARLWSELRREL